MTVAVEGMGEGLDGRGECRRYQQTGQSINQSNIHQSDKAAEEEEEEEEVRKEGA